MQIRNTMFILSGLKPLSISYKYNFILVVYSNVQLVLRSRITVCIIKTYRFVQTRFHNTRLRYANAIVIIIIVI